MVSVFDVLPGKFVPTELPYGIELEYINEGGLTKPPPQDESASYQIDKADNNISCDPNESLLNFAAEMEPSVVDYIPWYTRYLELHQETKGLDIPPRNEREVVRLLQRTFDKRTECLIIVGSTQKQILTCSYIPAEVLPFFSAEKHKVFSDAGVSFTVSSRKIDDNTYKLHVIRLEGESKTETELTVHHLNQASHHACFEVPIYNGDHPDAFTLLTLYKKYATRPASLAVYASGGRASQLAFTFELYAKFASVFPGDNVTDDSALEIELMVVAQRMQVPSSLSNPQIVEQAIVDAIRMRHAVLHPELYRCEERTPLLDPEPMSARPMTPPYGPDSQANLQREITEAVGSTTDVESDMANSPPAFVSTSSQVTLVLERELKEAMQGTATIDSSGLGFASKQKHETGAIQSVSKAGSINQPLLDNKVPPQANRCCVLC